MSRAHWLNRVRPVELAELLKRFTGSSYGEFTIDGRTWYLDPASHFGHRLLSEGSYVPEETSALLSQLGPGDVFLDIGANEGWFSLRAAERIGPGGTAVAIEPQARLWPVILRNFLLNRRHNYVLVPYAAGSAEGFTEILLYPSLNTGASSLVPQPRTRARRRQKAGVLRLDQICRIHGISKVRLAKIDVEGFELEVLRGAGDLLGRQIEHIYVELHPPQLKALGQSPDEVEDLLRTRGYRKRQVAAINLWSLPAA
jgi:FkbM family methyltransferase